MALPPFTVWHTTKETRAVNKTLEPLSDSSLVSAVPVSGKSSQWSCTNVVLLRLVQKLRMALSLLLRPPISRIV